MKRGTPDHPKLKRLMALLQISKPAAIGSLELLWHFAAQYAPRGDIGRFSDDEIETACGWEGPPGALIGMLVSAKWVERHAHARLIVHDWADHCDNGVREKVRHYSPSFVGSGSKKKPRAHPEGVGSDPSPGSERLGIGNGSVGEKGERGRRGPIPDDLVMTGDFAMEFRGNGCRNPELAFKAFRLKYEGLREDRKYGWAINWSNKVHQWALHHRQYGCPCQGQGELTPKDRDRLAEDAAEVFHS